MTAHELQDLLRDVFEEPLVARDDKERDDPVADLADRMEGVRRVRTYDDIGMLTRDKGLVIECGDGGQLPVSIVQNR